MVEDKRRPEDIAGETTPTVMTRVAELDPEGLLNIQGKDVQYLMAKSGLSGWDAVDLAERVVRLMQSHYSWTFEEALDECISISKSSMST